MRPGMSDGHQQSLRFRHSGKKLHNYFLYYICSCPLNIIKVFDFDTQVKLTLTSFSINTFYIILVLRGCQQSEFSPEQKSLHKMPKGLKI
jgi:hypothetical protein